MCTNLEIYQNSLKLPRENLFVLTWSSSTSVKINHSVLLLILSIKEAIVPMLERDCLRFKFNTQINQRRMPYLFKSNIPTSFFQTKTRLIIFWKVYKTRKLLNCQRDAFQLWIKYFLNQEDYQTSISLHWDLRIKVKNLHNLKQIKRFISKKKNRLSNNKLRVYPDKVGLATIAINQ